MKIILRSVLLVAILAIVAGNASGALIAYEPFQGTVANDIDGNGSGIGWSDASWTDAKGVDGQFVYEDPGLSYKDLPVSGLSATYKANGYSFNTYYSRGLSTTITLDTDGDEVWASYLLDLQEIQAGREFGIELTNSGYLNSVFAFGKGQNKGQGLGTEFTADWKDVGTTSTGAKLLMLKLAYDGIADETVATLYIDGSSATPLGSASAWGSITNAGPTTIDGVNLFGYNSATEDNTLDEVRLGDTKADVIPEPTVLSLLGLMGIVYLLRKKLHRSGEIA